LISQFVHIPFKIYSFHTEDKRFIELASTKNDFQAERPACSSTEAEDNVRRMKGWAKRAPLTTDSAEKRRRGNQQGHKSHFLEIPRCLSPARVSFWSGLHPLLCWASSERAGPISHAPRTLSTRWASPNQTTGWTERKAQPCTCTSCFI